MNSNRFECCFELPDKGIYFNVENNIPSNFVSLAMFNNAKIETEVCIRHDDVERLVKILQDFIDGRKVINSRS